MLVIKYYLLYMQMKHAKRKNIKLTMRETLKEATPILAH